MSETVLKEAVVYASLASYASKRKGDRDAIGDCFDAEVKIDLSASIKMNGRRYTLSEQIVGQLHVGEPPKPTDEYSGPSAAALLAFVIRQHNLDLPAIIAKAEKSIDTVMAEDVKAVSAAVKSLAKPTGKQETKRGSLTFTAK